MAFLGVYFVSKRTFCQATSNVRVRFAPSPTGYLHIGSLRTALFNYLFAKKHPNGKFILRIEDTDQTRIVRDSVKVIKEDLSWFGIVPDEGPGIFGSHGPYMQSERLDLYKKYAYKLLNVGDAYRCFCSPTRLELLRKEARKKGISPQYDNRCRLLTHDDIKKNLSAGIPFAIRYKLKPGTLKFKDVIAGDCAINLEKLEGSDPIIYKSDGYPTYHLANVVDDHHMKISHVFRAIEWLNSTPKHLMLFDSLGWTPPIYGHLPLIVNADGSKLSKRVSSLSIKALREAGYEPETLITYLAVLSGGMDGISIDSIEKVYSLDELVTLFDITAITTNANRLDEHKMLAVNKLSLDVNTDRHLSKLRQMISAQLSPEIALDDEKLFKLFEYTKERISTLNEFVSKYGYLVESPEYTFNLSKYEKSLQLDMADLVEKVIKLIEGNMFTLENIKKIVGESKYPKLMQFIRCCLCDTPTGPPVIDLLDILGKDIALKRLKRSLEYIKKE